MNLPTVGLVILAAGASTRMGTPKQLLKYRGRSLLSHIALSALASQCHPIVVVLGAQAERIKPEVNYLALHIVNNPQWAEGMGTSIRTGVTAVRAVNPNIEAVAIVLCDQPFVSVQLLNRLVAVYHSTCKPIVAAEYAGILGVPALFSRAFFAELMALGAAEGAKQVIYQHIHEVERVPFPEGAIDIDTPNDYEQLRVMTGEH